MNPLPEQKIQGGTVMLHVPFSGLAPRQACPLIVPLELVRTLSRQGNRPGIGLRCLASE
ncbi:hypothetical protein [Pseudomonas sp. 382]|uniref:hypothetical protein n=1 Tax=Pseudomonas sp. 382 TaxID=1751969 RepID=UPI000B0AB95C|nr:hypothetical protein [Pseudomonas sp. 382]